MASLNFFQLYKVLSRNNRLGFMRSPAFDQSVIAKVLMFLGGGLFVVYLLFYGTMFGSIAASDGDFSFIIATMPFIMLFDYVIRFMVQQTPAMLMKPYMLLPLPRRSVIDTFLVTSQLSIYNFLWLALVLPYLFVSLAGGCEWWLALQILLAFHLLIVTNSQFYLLVRILTGRSLFWWALPLVVYGLFFLPLLIDTKGKLFAHIFDGIIDFSATPLLLPVVLVVYVLVFWINREIQYSFVYKEIEGGSVKKVDNLKTVSQMSFFERFGQTGEYLKLELKSIFRNKVIRWRAMSSMIFIVILSGIIAYTDVYDGRRMLNFWCFYCFALYGTASLVKVMCPEGNYIDLLMVHRENTLTLMRAKYYFHVAILVVPLIIMLPAVFSGKFPWLMMLGYFFLTSGLLYFLLFQLAVYNKQTLPLDQKITGKGNVENGIQLIFEMVAFILPITLVSVLLLFFDETTAYLTLAAIGLFFTLTHPLWLRNVYKRMMKRKYENLEGFHASR